MVLIRTTSATFVHLQLKVARRHQKTWTRWNHSIASDPRLLARWSWTIEWFEFWKRFEKQSLMWELLRLRHKRLLMQFHPIRFLTIVVFFPPNLNISGIISQKDFVIFRLRFLETNSNDFQSIFHKWEKKILCLIKFRYNRMYWYIQDWWITIEDDNRRIFNVND